MNLIVGIDTGLQGAIAFLDAATRNLLGIEDMPVDRVTVGASTKAKTVRGRVSAVAVVALLKGMEGHAFLERPEARPLRGRDRATGAITLRQPGAAGMLAFGESYGVVYCACIAAGLRVTEVRPGSWKREMSISGDKDEARRRACELFPTWASYFARVKDDGRAEAALLALWGAERSLVPERAEGERGSRGAERTRG